MRLLPPPGGAGRRLNPTRRVRSTADMRLTILNKTAGGISGGYRKYLQEVVPRIASSEAVSAVQLLAPAAWRPETWIPLDELSSVLLYKASRLARVPTSASRFVREFEPDVIFIPAERSFALGTVPVVNMLRNIEPFTPSIRGRSVLESLLLLGRRLDARRALSGAVRTIVPTEYVRQHLVTHEGIRAQQLVPIHFGVVGSGSPLRPARPRNLAPDVERGFLFTAGSVRPARGLEDAHHGHARLGRRTRRHRAALAAILTGRR